MFHNAILVVAAALLGAGRSANVIKHMRQLAALDNSIEDVVSPKHFGHGLNLTRKPGPVVAHTPGTTAELSCEAYGSPAPSIHWYKNDAPVYEHGAESNELIDTNPESLARVVSTLLVTQTESEDRYKCFVRSGSEVASASFMVYRADDSTESTERSRLHPFAPRILVTYKVYLDVIGNNVVLPCRARGHPRPHITWTHRGNRDTVETILRDNSRMKVLRSGELVITPLRWSDMGEYVCHATNGFGSQRAVTFVYPTIEEA